MAEFKRNIAGANTGFTQVSPTGGSGSSAVVGQAISDVVQGVSMFAKDKARSAGVQAAESQTGAEIPLAEVNRDVDDIQQQLDEALMYEQSLSDDNQINQRRIQEIKEESLRSARLTDRHIQGLMKAGVMSSTEANARRRLELSRLKNQGANFLFSSEFDDAFFSATGGSRGSAATAIFPQTPDEVRAAEIQKAKLKAEADVAAGIQTIQSTLPYLSREEAAQEYATSMEMDKRIKEIELIQKERSLRGDEISQALSLSQVSNAQGMELIFRNNLDENGLMPFQNTTVVKQQISQAAEIQRRELAATSQLDQKTRNSLEADIDAWEEAQNSRLSLYDKASYNKDLLETIETSNKLFGIASSPEIAILAQGNPDLAKDLLLLGSTQREGRLRTYLGDEGFEKVLQGASFIRNVTNFHAREGMRVETYDPPAIVTQTVEGLRLMTEAMGTPGKNDPKYMRMIKNSPSETLNSVGSIPWISKAAQGDEKTQLTVKKTFDIYMNDLRSEALTFGTKMPEVRVKERDKAAGTFASAGPGSMAKTLALSLWEHGLNNVPLEERFMGSAPIPVVEMPDELLADGDPKGYSDSIKKAYYTFTNHEWIWKGNYDNSVEAFNAYMKGQFEITPEAMRKVEEAGNETD